MNCRNAATRSLLAASLFVAAATASAASLQKPATIVSNADHSAQLAATRAGARIVAVGDHGVVLLSDDDGAHFRQARAVPTQALLTSVCFVDARTGWIAGHDGVILHTADGGETWTLQREDTDGDKPLFAIAFRDAQHGFAVGLFGTAARTDDGGAHWSGFELLPGKDEDHHLYGIFGNVRDGYYIAAEAGLIYRSFDAGATWDEIQTTDAGSFWTGARLPDGSLVAAGQRGHVFRSDDKGATWAEVPSGTQESLTEVLVLRDGDLRITGLAGVLLASTDGGRHFTLEQRADRAPLTAAVESSADSQRLVLFGGGGVVHSGK